jgi:hypothetical protein
MGCYKSAGPGSSHPDDDIFEWLCYLPIWYMVAILVMNRAAGWGWSWPFLVLWFVLKLAFWLGLLWVLAQIVSMVLMIPWEMFVWVRGMYRRLF